MSTTAPLIGAQVVRVHDLQAQVEPDSRPALGDVAAELLAREVVRAFGHLRREDAADSDRGAGGACAAEGTEPERGDREAADAGEETVTGDPFDHGPTVQMRSGKAL